MQASALDQHAWWYHGLLQCFYKYLGSFEILHGPTRIPSPSFLFLLPSRFHQWDPNLPLPCSSLYERYLHPHVSCRSTLRDQ